VRVFAGFFHQVLPQQLGGFFAYYPGVWTLCDAKHVCFTARTAELNGQLKTVRSQAESAKQELVDYRDKATRILQVGLTAEYVE